jgi:small subunit ribosomal protein S17e
MVLEKHKQQFTKDFEKNKEILSRKIKVESKKIRNQIAGYITRIMKQET